MRDFVADRTPQNQDGEARQATLRMLTFCSHQEELAGIKRDRKGLTGTEIVGVFGKDLVFTGYIFALSRRRQGFETPWDCQRLQSVTVVTAHFPPGVFPRFFCHFLISCPGAACTQPGSQEHGRVTEFSNLSPPDFDYILGRSGRRPIEGYNQQYCAKNRWDQPQPD